MPCDLEGSVVKWADPPRTRAREWRRHACGDLTGGLIATVGLSTDDVINANAHDGRDSVQSSAEKARRRCMLVIIMRYQDSRIRYERRVRVVR